MKVLPKPDGLTPCIDNRIRKDTVWACLTDEEVALFNRKVICRVFEPGETIFLEGDSCKGIYFIEGGLIGVRKSDRDGQSVLLRVAGDGDNLGYRPFLAKQPHRASAEVIEDAKVCFIDGPVVRTILHDNHELGLQFLERTAAALGDADERLYEISALNVDTRIVHLLILFHDKWGSHLADGSVTISLPISREDLASMIGAHPDSISRAIRQLENKGLLKFDGRSIRIDRFDHLADQLHANLTHYH